MKYKVIVEILGGVAEVTSCPDNVEVEIIDHDILKDIKEVIVETQ